MVPGHRHQLLSLLAALVMAGCRLGYEVMDGRESGPDSFGAAGAPAGLGGTQAVDGAGDGNGGSGDPSSSSSGGTTADGGTNGSTETGAGGGAPSAGGSGGATETAGSTGDGNAGSGGGGNAGSGGGGTARGGASGAGGSAGTGAGATGGTGGTGGSAGTGGTGGCSITNSGVEACDGLDNDCNGMVDETDPCAIDCFGAANSGQGYMFCGTPLLWADAQAYCAASSMSLVRIDDAEENAWVLSTAHSEPSIAAAFAFFIGASDPVEGEWIWSDGEQFWSGNANGSPVGGLYSNWGSIDPNDRGAGGEDCAAMRTDGSWNDVRCSGADSEMPFACETP